MSNSRHNRHGFPEVVPSIADMSMLPTAMSESRPSQLRFPEIEPSGTGILLTETSSSSAYFSESFPGGSSDQQFHIDQILRDQLSCIVCFYINNLIIFLIVLIN
jgi:hypothetical protein